MIKLMMKKYFLLPVFLFSILALNAQDQASKMPDSVKNYLEKSFKILEEKALNKNKIDWNTLKKNVYDKAGAAKTYEDILFIYPYIFEQIDDHHGALKFRDKTYGWNGHGNPKKNKVITDAINTYTEVRSELLGNNIGYLLIPGNNDFRGQRMDEISGKIKSAIAKISNKKIKGWIIDLRTNTGGNMYPMIAGIGDLLGDGKLGSFVTNNHEPEGEWILKNGNLYIDTVKASAVKYEGYPVRSNLPIAVLIGPYTASSGEMTAISMKGRAKTIWIGEASAGYTTVNNGFELNSYSGLNLAIDYAADRNGSIYPKKLIPDLLVEGGDQFENLKADKKVQRAKAWILKH